MKQSLESQTTIRRLLPGKTAIEENRIVAPKGPQYHYTSPEAFLSIIRNRKLRFSDIRYMNDKTEGIYFVKVLLDFMDKNRERYPYVQSAINSLIGQNNFRRIQDLDISEISFKEVNGFHYEKNRKFLFCTSGENDALNMWNYYIHNGQYQGYNLGLQMESFLRTFSDPAISYDRIAVDEFEVYYGNVLYTPKEQYAEMELFLNDLEKMARQGEAEWMIALRLQGYISNEGLFYKHAKFKNEKEFRIVISIAESQIPHTRDEQKALIGTRNKNIQEDFYIRNGLVVPCLNVQIPEDAISRITVAPIMEFEIAKQSVKEILALSGFPTVPIYKSIIPVRF